MSTNYSYRPKLAYQQTTIQSIKSSSAAVASTSFRPFYLRGDISSQAAGSATCELGKTKVLCSIYGPRQRKSGGRAEFAGRGAIDVEASFAPYSRRQYTRKEDLEKESRELSLFLENTLESSVQLHRFPKSVLDVYLIVLEDDGSVYACAALCASFALAKSGVEMYDLVSCCTLSISSNGNIELDPNLEEETNSKALCTVGTLSTSGKLVCFDVKAEESTPEIINKLLSVGLKACAEKAKVMREQLIFEEQEKNQSS